MIVIVEYKHGVLISSSRRAGKHFLVETEDAKRPGEDYGPILLPEYGIYNGKDIHDFKLTKNPHPLLLAMVLVELQNTSKNIAKIAKLP